MRFSAYFNYTMFDKEILMLLVWRGLDNDVEILLFTVYLKGVDKRIFHG